GPVSAVETFTFEQLSGGVIEVSAESSAAVRAAGVVAQAQAEAEAIRADARELGFAEGHADGLAAAAAGLDPKRALLEAAAVEVRAALAELTAHVEREAVELALVLADKILATALDVRPELVQDVVVGCLRGVVDRDLVLEVHPDDLSLLEGCVEGIELYA